MRVVGNRRRRLEPVSLVLFTLFWGWRASWHPWFRSLSWWLRSKLVAYLFSGLTFRSPPNGPSPTPSSKICLIQSHHLSDFFCNEIRGCVLNPKRLCSTNILSNMIYTPMKHAVWNKKFGWEINPFKINTDVTTVRDLTRKLKRKNWN